MVKKKKQKVRFHKGDRRPGKLDGKLSYTTEMEKVRRKNKKLDFTKAIEDQQRG